MKPFASPVESVGLGLVLCAVLSGGSAVTAAEHAFGDFQINVAADDGAGDESANYQITVADQDLILTRLSASSDGTLSNSFVADLNKDGAFEVIVTFSYAAGQAPEVHLYSWNEYLLEPHKVADLDNAQRDGYNGNDEFALANGEFVRIFQLYEQNAGEWLPTAQRRRLRYSFDDSRWLTD